MSTNGKDLQKKTIKLLKVTTLFLAVEPFYSYFVVDIMQILLSIDDRRVETNR